MIPREVDHANGARGLSLVRVRADRHTGARIPRDPDGQGKRRNGSPDLSIPRQRRSRCRHAVRPDRSARSLRRPTHHHAGNTLQALSHCPGVARRTAQAGRYREFVQCDFDTIGTESVLADIEAVAVINSLLVAIGFDRFTISINNRVILIGLAAASRLVRSNGARAAQLGQTGPRSAATRRPQKCAAPRRSATRKPTPS